MSPSARNAARSERTPSKHRLDDRDRFTLSMNFAPHPFSLRQLQYCVAVAEKLSFRKAAEQCRVSQPSLSAQLAQLEAALGVQLFERSRKRVLVTAAGRDLVE